MRRTEARGRKRLATRPTGPRSSSVGSVVGRKPARSRGRTSPSSALCGRTPTWCCSPAARCLGARGGERRDVDPGRFAPSSSTDSQCLRSSVRPCPNSLPLPGTPSRPSSTRSATSSSAATRPVVALWWNFASRTPLLAPYHPLQSLIVAFPTLRDSAPQSNRIPLSTRDLSRCKQHVPNPLQEAPETPTACSTSHPRTPPPEFRSHPSRSKPTPPPSGGEAGSNYGVVVLPCGFAQERPEMWGSGGGFRCVSNGLHK